MKEHAFSLQPFPDSESLSDLQFTGSIVRQNNQLSILYIVGGNLSTVVVAPPSNTPLRKHELWQDTCFEFFLGIKDAERYWEFNLSSAGHWNVYRFDSYRQGMQEETAFTALPFSVQNQSDNLAVALDVNLSKIISAEQNIQVAITSVIKQNNQNITYWALTHRVTEPDFHLRDSFMIEL